MYILTLSLALTACGDKTSDTGENTDSNANTPLAEELWGEIDDLSGWNQMLNWEGVVASSTAHGSFVQIWLNDAAFDALSSGAAVPDGGIIVKESYNDAEGTDLNNYTVMKKITAYNSSAADWFWANFAVDGSINIAGTPDACTSCHSSSEDYLQFTNQN